MFTGLKGVSDQTEGTFKVSKPRDDVSVSVEQNHMAPFMGLTSWAAFMPFGKGRAMVMGDMVLFEDEVNPVMSVAINAGLQVTALHNHFFFDKPKVYFMHIGGEGLFRRSPKGSGRFSIQKKEFEQQLLRLLTPLVLNSYLARMRSTVVSSARSSSKRAMRRMACTK